MNMLFDLKTYGDEPAFIEDNGKRISYSELNHLCEEIGSEVPAGNLVFILCNNSIGSAAGYVSFINNGVVSMLLDKLIEREALHRLLVNYEPQYMYVPSDMASEFEDTEKVREFYDYSLLKTAYQDKPALTGELALLLTTSGSTGSPKFVRQSLSNVKANAESIAEYLEITRDERAITTLPMYYTYGLSIINSHIIQGACVLLTSKSIMMRGFWDFLSKEKATSFGGVPATYELLAKRQFFKKDLPSLRYITQAGGKLPKDLHQAFGEWAEKNNKKFIVMYGQTEATARMSYLPAEKCLEKCGSIGIAIPGGKFSLIDVNGETITAPYQQGELVYEGRNVTLGYAECRTDLEKGDERCGKLITGDIAYVDQDGYYYIAGRKKRFLKIFGNRVNLDEIDILIKKKFTELDAASTGSDDHLVTFITDSSKTNEVKEYLSEITHLSQSAFCVLFIDEIPRNESGKVLYQKLVY